MPADRQCFKARWVVPVDAEPIEHGTVEVEAGRIVAVHGSHEPRARDLGNVAIVPGLVNAHTHLEFSRLKEPLRPPDPFTTWIQRVVAYRRDAATDLDDSILEGYEQSRHSGVTTLGEIAATDWPETQLPQGGPQAIVFRELRGLLPEKKEDQLAIARRYLQTAGATERIIHGISPHAPYSVHPDLFGELVDLAEQFSAPLAVHLAETRAELELLSDHRGEFVPTLENFGVWTKEAIPKGSRPLHYLRRLATLPHALVAHGNYLSPDEIDFVARHPNVAVVYCPRTHAFFGHAQHPWQQLLKQGATVAVGTDSRASNPDLSVWQELCFLHQRNPKCDPRLLLQMGTILGARALGVGHDTGSVTPGKAANLAVVSLAAANTTSAYRALFHRRSRITAALCAEEWVDCNSRWND